MEELTAFHKRLGIRIEGDFYVFQDYKYKNLPPAVEYAIKVTGMSEADTSGFELSEEDVALGISFENGFFVSNGTRWASYEEAKRLATVVASAIQREEVRIESRRAANLSSVIVVTTEVIPTYEILEVLGPVRGGTVRGKNIARDILADFKNVVGGEIVGYTELLAEAREEALYRMRKDAEDLGANAVIGFRFSTATIEVGSAEVTAYGTAVNVRKIQDAQS